MKFSVVATIAAIVGLAVAQDIPQIPGCALQCLSELENDASKTGCGALNLQNAACFCKKRSDFNPSISCVNRACNKQDAETAINAFLNRC